MDEQFLTLYERELTHIRRTAAEFAKARPKIARRLSLEEFDCADPYVERLLEGFAFLAARVQRKLTAEFPRFTQSLLQTLYPHYLAPTPSMAIVQFCPQRDEAGLADGEMVIPRETVLRGMLGPNDPTRCTFRTGHEVTLWPIELTEAQYYTRELATLEVPPALEAKAAVRLRLRTLAGLQFNEIKLDALTLYLRGVGREEMRLYEQLLGHAKGILLQPPGRPVPWQVPGGTVRRVGFDDEQRLLPYDGRSFHGYRLLHEYFAFPERFMFVELTGLGEAVRRCGGGDLDVIVLLDEVDTELEKAVDASNFVPFCTPAINLFPRRACPIELSDRVSEFHVVPDRACPEDFEIHQVLSVTGSGVRADETQEFKPFYAASDLDAAGGGGAYYAVNRRPRNLSSRDKLYGSRSAGYVGGEVYISLVDAKAAPYASSLRRLGISTLCTNRDLPIRMPHGQDGNDFEMDVQAPVEAIRCLRKTDPVPSHAEGELAWRAISHLALNYLSVTDDGQQGASAMRSLLSLYGDAGELATRHQIEGLQSVHSRPVVRRLVREGRVAFARGLEVTVTFEEAAYRGTGVFLLGAVLERFYAKYVSMNSFTETVVRTVERGEVMRWPAMVGQRHIL